MLKNVREKCGKLQISYILSSERGITPTEIDKSDKLALYYIKTKSWVKFRLNVSKQVGEKHGKPHITYILSSQRDITPSNIDTK